MTVIRWNPLREIDDLFAGHFPQVTRARAVAPEGAYHFTPLADVSETDAGYLIELELPGVAGADVDVSVHEGVLRIAGERKSALTGDHLEHEGDESENAAAAHAAEDDSRERDVRRVHRSERKYGKFERRFRLPKDARADAIEASATDGVLSVTIARQEAPARRAIEVKVA